MPNNIHRITGVHYYPLSVHKYRPRKMLAAVSMETIMVGAWILDWIWSFYAMNFGAWQSIQNIVVVRRDWSEKQIVIILRVEIRGSRVTDLEGKTTHQRVHVHQSRRGITTYGEKERKRSLQRKVFRRWKGEKTLIAKKSILTNMATIIK